MRATRPGEGRGVEASAVRLAARRRAAANASFWPPACGWRACLVLLASASFQATTATADSLPPVWVESSFIPPEVEVQQQATYVLRFYQSVSVNKLELVPPEFERAEIRPLGQWRVAEEGRGSVRYRVTEARFAVFPFASGTLRAEGAYAAGLMASADSGRAVERRRFPAPPASIQVRRLPSGASSSWLPAGSVELGESWQWSGAGPMAGRVGEPLLRTVRIVARGVVAGQIVGPQVASDDFLVHGEAPRREDRDDGEANLAVFEQRWRLVPRATGSLQLPPIVVEWWDVSRGSFRSSSLPGAVIRVADSASVAESPLALGDETLRPSSGHDSSVLPAAAPTETRRSPAANWLPALVVLLCFATVALTAWRVWERGRCWRRARAACRDNDAPAAKAALLAYAAEGRGDNPPASLRSLLRDGRVSRGEYLALWPALLELERACYGPELSWRGESLARLLPHLRRRWPIRSFGWFAGRGRATGKSRAWMAESGPMPARSASAPADPLRPPDRT